MKYDRAAVDLALNEIDSVDPGKLPKILKEVRRLQAHRMLKIRDLWPAELEAVARHIEAKIPSREPWSARLGRWIRKSE